MANEERKGRVLLQFRHNGNGLTPIIGRTEDANIPDRMIVIVPMPDEIIGDLMFRYLQHMGVQVKLLETTDHPATNLVLREAH